MGEVEDERSGKRMEAKTVSRIEIHEESKEEGDDSSRNGCIKKP